MEEGCGEQSCSSLEARKRDGKEEKREGEKEREICSTNPIKKSTLQRHAQSDLLLSVMPQFLIAHSAVNSLMS